MDPHIISLIFLLSSILSCFIKSVNSAPTAGSSNGVAVDVRTIQLFKHSNFEGPKVTVMPGAECMNFAGQLNDYFSSIETSGQCVELCSEVNCGGRCETFGAETKERHRDFATIDFNDIASSLRICSRNTSGERTPNVTNAQSPS